MGAGFRERQTAFDFLAALQDFQKYVSRRALAEQRTRQADEEESDPTVLEASAHIRDMSLHEGQKILLNIKGTGSSTGRRREKKGLAPATPILPPPVSYTDVQQKMDSSQHNAEGADEDWTEFEAA
jgi:hypothetical protein